LIREKWIVVSFTAIFSIGSIFYALSLPNMYKSRAILAPAESSSGGLASLAGNLGGLASLAGFSIGDVGGSNLTAEALEIIQSWAFIEEFIQEQNIAPEVFAVKGWDQQTNELIYNTDIFDPRTETWVREPPKGKKPAPSSWELFEVFQEYMSVEEEQAGFTSLSIEYFSPEIAKHWVDALVLKINAKLQARNASAAEKNVAFLKQQIEETTLASMQSVFYELIEEQTKTLMLARGSTEYVFKTVNESRVAEEKSKPRRALICIFSAMLGGVLGSVIALVRGLKEKE
jgi:uncharacterized protein involved in exopolysaccharide biosynthesis